MVRILILLCGVLCLTGCNPQTTIVTNVPEREANEIVVLLSSKGIQAEKMAAPVTAVGGAAAPGFHVSVPSDQIRESLSILNAAGLPRMKGKTLLDLFGSQGLVPSELQDSIRYQEGLSEQLGNTIRKMDGIVDANVQITFPRTEGESVPMTASVYVKHRGVLDNPNSLMTTKIKRLVSSALPGLSIENVSVVTDRAPLADISLSAEMPEQTKDYISIWSITLAKESASRFRVIFYAFLILLFLLISLLAWVMWKFSPLIRKEGMQMLWKPEPYEPKQMEEPPPNEPSEEE